MQGITTTTRAYAKKSPDQQSLIAKRHATVSDLERACGAIGTQVQLSLVADTPRLTYRIADVRLDTLQRLIVDLVQVEQ